MLASPLWLYLLTSAFGSGTVLRYAEDRAPAIVNPLFATTMSEARIDELVFDGLFTDDFELRSQGRLADSFELAQDRMSMVVRLKRDVTWHDGKDFDAEDVVFTIEAYKDPRTASSEAGPAVDTDRRAFLAAVEKALGGLPERQRRAVVLFDVEGYSHAEIASIMEVPQGTVRSDVFHGRRALRRSLGAWKDWKEERR